VPAHDASSDLTAKVSAELDIQTIIYTENKGYERSPQSFGLVPLLPKLLFEPAYPHLQFFWHSVRLCVAPDGDGTQRLWGHQEQRRGDRRSLQFYLLLVFSERTCGDSR